MVPQDMLKLEFLINQLFSKLMKKVLIQELLSVKLIPTVLLSQTLITKSIAEITILFKELKI
jgi:hypothetical protein